MRVRESKPRRILVANTIRTLGAMLWPVVLLSSVDAECKDSRLLMFPLAWNLGAWALDSYIMNYAPSSNPERPATLRLEPQSITALTFGLCGLVEGQGPTVGTHLFSQVHPGMHHLSTPHAHHHPNTMEEQVFESVQKAALIWCIGLLIAGVSLSAGCADQTIKQTI